MPQFAKSTSFRIAAVAALLVGLYAIGGFWLVPKLLRSALLKDVPEAVGMRPTVGEIRFNPFLLQLQVENFSLADSNGEKVLGFERFFIEFEFSSLWRRAYTFGDIEIEAPFLSAIVFKDGGLNLAQLSPKSSAPKSAPKAAQADSGSLPALRIGTFKVSRGLVTYEDRSRASDFSARLQPIDFELHDFTTGIEGGRFTFTGVSKLNERIEWHGRVAVQPIESDGEFRIDGLEANTIWEYLKDQLSFQVNSGKIDVDASYTFALKDAVDLKLQIAKVALTDLTVRPKQSDSDWITLPEMILAGGSVDLLRRQAHADSLSLTGLKLVTWMEPDGSLNLLKLAAPPAAAPAAPAAAAAPGAPSGAPVPAAPSSASGPAWQVDLAEFSLQGASISAEDRATRPAAKVMLAPLSLKVSGASGDLSRPVRVALDTKINETGSLVLSGDLTPQPLSANLSVQLKDIGLAAIQPYIAQHTSMTLLAGALSGDLKVRYAAKRPTLQLGGDISVANLHTVDNALRADFINWERLDVQGIEFQHDPDRLNIDQILARKPYARVIIEPDESINVKRVLQAPGATLIAPEGPRGAPVTVVAPAPPPPPAAASRRHAPAVAAAAPATAPLMPISIKKIVLRAGQANFADLSVTPNFATGIQNLEGTVLGLSSAADSRAKIDIHGSVDAFAPVSISGEVNVLGPALYTDLALSFRNIELSTFNPYSGKFAGYNISKGKLTTELHYKVEGRKLDAQHHIIVDQLEFGAKTESKDAVSLPVKLAVALLKDRDGVIDLNLPVNGTLDDPKFRLGPIIWKVFINILEKAVTAPFALLGSLFGGGPDLQFVDFQPGSADLDPSAVDKAQAMVKALNARPQLKIEVPIAVVGELDRPKLIDVKLQTQIQEAQIAATARKKPQGAAPAFDQLEPAARLDILAQLYAKDLGAEPKFPETIAAIKTKPEAIAAKIDFLSSELHAQMTISEADLTALGQQRAANLQAALLTGTQIDPARVFLVANDKAKNDNGKVRLEFSLR